MISTGHFRRVVIRAAASLFVGAFAAGGASAQVLEQSDHGNFEINTLEAPNGNVTYKGVIVKLGKNDEAAVCFDTELLRFSAGWVKGSLNGKPAEGWAGLIDPRKSTSFTASHGGPPMIGVLNDNEPRKKGQPAPKPAVEQLRVATKFGPGWAKGESFDDPRTPPKADKGAKLGPLPRDWSHWNGLYRNGDHVVFSYTVGTTAVLETPGLISGGTNPAFTRTFNVAAHKEPLAMVVADGSTEAVATEPSVVAIAAAQPNDTAVAAGMVAAPSGAALKQEKDRIVAHLPASTTPAVFRIVVWSGPKADVSKFAGVVKSAAEGVVDPSTLTKGGPAQWGEPLEATGKLNASGKPDDAYVVDNVAFPDKNPWKAIPRFAGLDFFSDGARAALSTIGGDVWIVSGIDEKLEHLKWKRFATGLFQPLGLRIVNDQVYTIGRDGITHLVDLNGDGEADFYENINNDAQVTTNYHEFCLDLQTDPQGNFYYPKGSPWPPNVKSDYQGTMIKVSKDGAKSEIVATGLRAPNGTGMSPDGQYLVASDNQGHWEPACKVSWIRPGKFYGMVPAAHSPDGKVPTEFEQPIFWIPMSMDNSSGGEAFAPANGKWGPLNGHMVHMSYGKSTLFNVMTEMVGDVMQGALVQFPLKFDSSLMRGRFNPKDGQFYVTGLKGWQTNAGHEGALSRVRYTGQPTSMPVEFHVHKNGVSITFASALDKDSATDADNWGIEEWNYKWTGNYGSPEFSVKDPKKAKHDEVEVKKASLSADGKTVFLQTEELVPVNQMRIRCNLKVAGGKEVKWDIYNTINKVGPEQKTAADSK
jgi:hypothetical protein